MHLMKRRKNLWKSKVTKDCILNTTK